MSWRAGLSRHLPCMRFFACPESPSSRGVMNWYAQNYDHIKLLNPNFPFMMRTVENAMPAVTTELEWTVQDLLRFMIQTGRFRDSNGSISEARVDAAKDYLATDWDKMALERWKSPGFDPERPGLDREDPGWKENPKIQADLGTYFGLKQNSEDLIDVIKSGPNDEYIRAENALLMCQRVDLWCAGEKEVEQAVIHLYKLGRSLNDLEVEYPAFISEFHPGQDDMCDS